MTTSGGEKRQRFVELLRDGLRRENAAVVFCATRKTAETIAQIVAQIVAQQGIACGCYHDGLTADLRKETPRRLLDGERQVIAATNTLGHPAALRRPSPTCSSRSGGTNSQHC
jgi:ATP-dependent DNA helicase RecQ